MYNSLIYDIYPISINEFGFRTQYNIIYDAYFLDKTVNLSYEVRELFPKLSLWEFGFDRFMFDKGIHDPKIADTLFHILSSFFDSDRIVYSRVYNPVGQHNVLNRLYIQNLRKKAKKFIPFSIYLNTISGEEFILITYYSELSNFSIDSFFKCMSSTISYCFEEDPVHAIRIYNILNLTRVNLPFIK